MERSKFRSSLFRFPPDLTFGLEPTSKESFRAIIGIMNLLKNVIPMVVVEQFQRKILGKSFDSIPALSVQLESVIPYTFLLLTIFPINAAIGKLDRYWQNYISIDLQSGRMKLFRQPLPLTDLEYDRFNNKMDIYSKIFFYSGFASFPLSFTLPFPDSLLPLCLGTILFAIQGYQCGWWLDIQNRVKVRTIFESERQLGR